MSPRGYGVGHDRDLIQWATEIKIRAERKTGEFLRQIEKRHGARGIGKKVDSVPIESTLEEKFGITPDQSSDWQALAAIPEQEFEQRLAQAAEDSGAKP